MRDETVRGVEPVHTPLSIEAVLAAVFAGGEGAALSHLSAAELCRVGRRRDARIHVVSPHQRRSTSEIQFHRANRLHRRDVTSRNGIPVTSMARLLVDLSDVLTPHQLANVIHEDAFLALLRTAGIDEPRVNTQLLGFEVDCHWPELKLAVEVDGPGHGRTRTRRDDAEEDRTLRAAGYRILRFTDEDIDHRPADVLTRVRTEVALAQAG